MNHSWTDETLSNDLRFHSPRQQRLLHKDPLVCFCSWLWLNRPGSHRGTNIHLQPMRLEFNSEHSHYDFTVYSAPSTKRLTSLSRNWWPATMRTLTHIQYVHVLSHAWSYVLSIKAKCIIKLWYIIRQEQISTFHGFCTIQWICYWEESLCVQ